MARSKGPSRPEQPLTDRQIKFVEAYCGEAKGNGTNAARLAGYSGNYATLATAASQLLKSDKVIAAIEHANRSVRSDAVATRREVQEGLTAIARGNIERELAFNPMGAPIFLPDPGPDGKLIHYSKPVPAQARLGAYETLAKMFGMLVSKIEIASASERFRAHYERVAQRVKAGEITDPGEALSELLKSLAGD